MANEHAIPAEQVEKKHGDELQDALKDSTGSHGDKSIHNNAIPPAEDGGHNRSVADVVRAAIQEDVDGIAISSYQGGHTE